MLAWASRPLKRCCVLHHALADGLAALVYGHGHCQGVRCEFLQERVAKCLPGGDGLRLVAAQYLQPLESLTFQTDASSTYLLRVLEDRGLQSNRNSSLSMRFLPLSLHPP